jgi:hypothetical protein
MKKPTPTRSKTPTIAPKIIPTSAGVARLDKDVDPD